MGCVTILKSVSCKKLRIMAIRVCVVGLLMKWLLYVMGRGGGSSDRGGCCM